jgi:polyhydroxybutyrate depolymerase
MSPVDGRTMRRSRLVIGVVLLATVLAGCSWFPGGRPTTGPLDPDASPGCVTATPRGGTQTIQTTSGGVARTYVRRVPQGYDPKVPTPVVFSFHGLGEPISIHVLIGEWESRADAQRFIVVWPQGLGDTPQWETELGSSDLTFFGNVLDEVERDLCVDRRRVFAEGYSMGAYLSSSIACQFSDRVAAVGMVAGIRNPTGCAPSRPVPAVTFHGTADATVEYAPIPGFVAAWAARNHCFPNASVEPVAPDVALTRYLCPTGSEVGFYRVEGGGHTWPGSAFSRQVPSLGFTTLSIHATDIMWDFFARHPLPA